MKTRIASWIGLAALTVATFASSAAALPVPGSAEDVVVAKVPFAFRVGASEFPAGTYVARAIDESSNVVAIEDVDGHQVALLLTVREQSDEIAKPEMVFRKLDNHFYLAKVVQENGDTREIMPTPAQAQAEAIAAEAAASQP